MLCWADIPWLVCLQVEGGAEEGEGTGEGGASPGEGEDTPMDSQNHFAQILSAKKPSICACRAGHGRAKIVRMRSIYQFAILLGKSNIKWSVGVAQGLDGCLLELIIRLTSADEWRMALRETGRLLQKLFEPRGEVNKEKKSSKPGKWFQNMQVYSQLHI